MADRRTLLRSGTALAAAAWLAGCTPGGADGAGSSTPTGRTSPSGSTRPSGPPAPADWNALARGLHGTLVRPDDTHYDTARRLYNTRFDGQRPAAVAYVAHTSDIAECLAYARHARVPVSIRSGGHSYAGWSSGNGRLVVDVSRLSDVSVSTGAATIGAGARLADVYDTLGAHGATLPAGSCPTVGISGLTLGGGHGVASRAYGLTCDSLTGATLVTADGTVLRVDAGHHPDLFWALRGAGNGNFGVVTELRFRTHAAPACVTGYLSWPWSRDRAVRAVTAWQEWGPDQPDEIWSSLHLDAAAGARPTLSVAAFSVGSYDDLNNAVDRLADRIGPASGVSLHPHSSYSEAMNAYAGCAEHTASECHLSGAVPGRTVDGRLERETYTARSDFYDRSLSAAGAGTLVAQTGTADRARRRIRQRRPHRARRRRQPGAGPRDRVHPPRLAVPGPVHRLRRAVRHRLARRHCTARCARTPRAPPTRTTPTPHWTDWRRAYYGPAADRLASVKRSYDPSRVFDYPQAV